MLSIRFLTVTLLLSLALVITATAQEYSLIPTGYRWLEIEDIGTPVEGLNDNDLYGPYPIGYDFPFFGRLYDEFYISSNGFIGFGPTTNYARSANTDIPDGFTPNNIVALYWKDLNPDIFWGSGYIYYGHREGKLVVEYQSYPENILGGSSPRNCITMQVILEPNGEIVLQYAKVGDRFDLATGTIGIENRFGTEGVRIRYNGEGADVADGTAFRLTPTRLGKFLVWDAGSQTPSGASQKSVLESIGHTVVYRNLSQNQQLPNDLADYEAVFVNLGNIGAGGNHYHQLTANEGAILKGYLDNGGKLYLEGSNSWTVDPATDVHLYFMIQGVANGGALVPPVTGLADGIGERMVFAGYQANHNNSVDHIAAVGNGIPFFSFTEGGAQVYTGMVGYIGDYHTIGCSFEFGALVDGLGGTKRELIERMITFFRTEGPQIQKPHSLKAYPGDNTVRLEWRWDEPEPQRLEILQLEHQVAALLDSPDKPSVAVRDEVIRLRDKISALEDELVEEVGRDELKWFKVYVDGRLYDITNGTTYTVTELANGREYSFTVTAVHLDPEEESKPAGPVLATPVRPLKPPYEDGFEQAKGVFVPTPVQGGWEWGIPAQAVGAGGGQRAWGTRLNGGYADRANWILTSPIIRLERLNSCWFNFKHFMEAEPGWDGGYLEISLDGGTRWSPIDPDGNYTYAQVFALNGKAGFSGSTGGWKNVKYNLGQFCNPAKDVEILIRFVFRSDDSNFRQYAGWFIDDIALSGPELATVRVTVQRREGEQIFNVQGATVTLGEYPPVVSDFDGVAVISSVKKDREYAVSISKLGFATLQDRLNVIGADFRRNMTIVKWDSRITSEMFEEDVQLDAGQSKVLYVDEENRILPTFRNAGQQATDYIVYINYGASSVAVGDRPPVPFNGEWQLIRTLELSKATNEQHFVSAEFVRDPSGPKNNQIVAAAGDMSSGDAYFYYFDRNGNYLSRKTQGGIGNNINGWGVRDLASDGTNLFGGFNEKIWIFNEPMLGNGFTMFNQDQPFLKLKRALAYDPAEEIFWMGDGNETWYKVDRSTGIILQKVTNHGLMRVSGMAWNPADPDGAFLYLLHQESEVGGAAVYRYNPKTGRFAGDPFVIAEENEGYPGGLFITNHYDTHNWTMGALIQKPDGNDILRLYNLQPRLGWVTVTPQSGHLEPNQEVDLSITIDAKSMVQRAGGGYSAIVEIYDTKADLVFPITIRFMVQGGLVTLTGTVEVDDEAEFNGLAVDLYKSGNREAGFADGLAFDQNVFLFQGLKAGQYEVRISHRGYDDYSSGLIDLNQNKQIDIVLKHIRWGGVHDPDNPLPALSGKVFNANPPNFGMQGATVYALRRGVIPPNAKRIVTALSDLNGNYSFTQQNFNGLLEAQWEIRAEKEGYFSPSVIVDIAEGQAKQADFSMDERLAVKRGVTDGRYDDKILVRWTLPGTLYESLELKSDNGQLKDGAYLPKASDIMAVRFEPEGLYDISSAILYMVHREDFNNAAFPDFGQSAFNVKVFDEDPETGLPNKQIGDGWIGGFANAQRWVNINLIGLEFRTGPFFIGWHDDANDFGIEAVGLDDNFDNQNGVFLYLDGEWRRYNGLPGDPMIRAGIRSRFDNAPPERQLRMVGNDGGANPAEVSLAPEWKDVALSLLTPSLPAVQHPFQPQTIDEPPVPGRDALMGYRISINGQVVEDRWNNGQVYEHQVGSQNENREYEYQITALYGAGQVDHVVPGVEFTGKANLPPGAVINPSVVANGYQYTVRWTKPAQNVPDAEFWALNCIDYAGCDIYLDGQLVAQVPAVQGQADYQWVGNLGAGLEGWHTVKLVARDEVPNYSPPVSVTAAIGPAKIYDFELAPQFVADAGWAWGQGIMKGPGQAHSGVSQWVTTPNLPGYQNDADWSLYTDGLYKVLGQTSRLEFYHYYDTEVGNDGGQVMVSVDEGEWEVILPQNGNYPSNAVAGLQNSPGYTGKTASWTPAVFDLSDYEGKTVRLRWRFGSDASISRGAGWFIDDVVLWNCELVNFGRIRGMVADQNGAPVPGAQVLFGKVSTVTDANGEYQLDRLIPGEGTLIVTKDGYADRMTDLTVEPGGEAVRKVDIYRPLLALDLPSFELNLQPGDSARTPVRVTNNGSSATPFAIRLTASSEALRDAVGPVRSARRLDLPARFSQSHDSQWETAFEFDLTSRGFSRAQGAIYIDGYFYLTVADPRKGNLFLKLDRDGALVETFPQINSSTGWGIRDLTTDGKEIYGSEGRTIIAKRLDMTDGTPFPGAPLTVNRALTYDESTNCFWVAEYDSPIYRISRTGEIRTVWADHSLTGIFGLAFHPEEEKPLYIFNKETNGNTGVYSANPSSGEIEKLHEFPGSPAGCFLTGSWDANRYILGGIVGDRLVGYEVAPRHGWVSVTPSATTLQPGESTNLTLSVKLPYSANQGDKFAADISVRAYGGEIATLPLQVNVAPAIRHYNTPTVTSEVMFLTVNEVTDGDRLAVAGSEIAVVTPRGDIAGWGRWLGVPLLIPVYSGDSGYKAGEPLHCVVWEPQIKKEFTPFHIMDGTVSYSTKEGTELSLELVTPVEQTITLAEGWNMISSHIAPLIPSPQWVFADLADNGGLDLAKDKKGNFWEPKSGFCNLSRWDSFSAYRLYLLDPVELKVSGKLLAPNSVIELSSGWNYVGYPLATRSDPETALSTVWDDILLIKNNDGQFAVPQYGFSGIAYLEPGQGYMIKSAVDRTFVYQQSADGNSPRIEPPQLVDSESSGSDMSVLIIGNGISTEGEILAVANDGRIIGYTELNRTPCGLILRGDNSRTAELDGAREGESWRLVFRQNGGETELTTQTVSGEMVYRTDSFATIQLDGSQLLPQKFEVGHAYPNPFNNRAVVKFALPAGDRVTVSVVDVRGRELYGFTNRQYAGGWHSIDINASHWSAGIYFFRLVSSQGSEVRKLALVK